MASKNKTQIKKNTINSIGLNAITTIVRHTTAAKKTQNDFQKGQNFENNDNRGKLRLSDLLLKPKSESTHNITITSIFDRIKIIVICVITH